jgi:acyl-CoA synthetase (AMP-forming)/AMP-acid ligase II
MYSNIPSAVRASAINHDKKTAMIFEDGAFTYTELINLESKAFDLFHSENIGCNDVVGLVIKNPPAFCIAMLALGRLGAIVIPINPKYSKELFNRILSRFQVNHLISDLELEVDLPVNITPIHMSELMMIEVDQTESIEQIEIAADKPYVLALPLLSSLNQEQQNHPRAILYTHGYMLERINKTLDGHTNASRLIPPDMNFTMGFLTAIGTLCKGGTIIFNSTNHFSDFISLAKQEKATHLFISAKGIEHEIETIDCSGDLVPTIEEFRILEGSPSPSLIQEILHKVSPKVYTSYGSAETGGLTLATPEILKKHPTSSGKVRAWVSLEIIDKNGAVVPQGEVGYIRAKSAIAAKHYFDEPAASAAHFKDGWFYTGDSGYFNLDNLLFLVD